MKLPFTLPELPSFMMGFFVSIVLLHAFMGNSLAIVDFAIIVLWSWLRYRMQTTKSALIEAEVQLAFSQESSLEDWLGKLGKCAREVYRVLLGSPDTSWPKEMLGEVTGYSHSSGGFNNALSNLTSLGLAIRNGDKTIRVNPEILGL